MSVVATNRLKFLHNKKNLKVAIIGIVLILVAVAVAILIFNKSRSTTRGAASIQTTTVMKGNFSISVTGSGPVESADKAIITPKIENTVTQVYFKEGDTVKAGDLLYEMDDADAKVNLKQAEVNLAQAELAQQNNRNNVSKLNIAAPFNGRVSSLTVKEADILSKGATVLTLIDQSKLKLTVPFNSVYINDITKGKSVTVHVQDLMQSVQGTVAYVNNVPFSTATGGELYNIEIAVDNPGSITEGMKANVEIETSKGNAASTDNGTFAYVNSQIVKSETGGTVNKVNVKEGQHVTAGQIMVEVSNDDLLLTLESNEVKLLDLNSALDSAKQKLGYCKIYAPIDGTIVSQDVKVGDVVKSGAVIANISNIALMECTIPIDELDIAKVKVGQKATIVADALAESSTRPLEGEVSKIAVEGTSSNGVTNYPVTIRILKPEGLRGGMNVNAEIFIENKSDALYVPIEAVQKIRNRTYVVVEGDPNNKPVQEPVQGKTSANEGSGTQNSSTGQEPARRDQSGSGGGTRPAEGTAAGGRNRGPGAAANGQVLSMAQINPAQAQYYANTILKPVEVGLNNESYIEIKSGLSEGDKVILPPRSAGQTGNTTNTARPAGGNPMGGMMGGGAGAPRVIQRGG